MKRLINHDATSMEPWNYLDFEESVSLMDQWNEQGLYTKAISEWLIRNPQTALVTTWPEAGAREILDSFGTEDRSKRN